MSLLHHRSHVPNQHFGHIVSTDDLVNALTSHHLRKRQHGRYNRPWHHDSSLQDSGSIVRLADDKFEIHLDVSQFKPEEISVKLDGQSVIVEGKHEEKEDEHGLVMRQFVRRYVVPQDHDLEKIGSSLSTDGMLAIEVPKKATTETSPALREIPIVQTGEPAQLADSSRVVSNGNGVP